MRRTLFVLPVLLLAACGDDGAVTPDGGATRDGSAPPRDGGGLLVDAGPTPEDAGIADAGEATPDASTDGGAPAGDASAPAQLTGIWEGVFLEDSGGGREPVPPGTFLVFEPGDVVHFTCTGSPLPYTTDGSTIVVDLGGSSVTWFIVELTDTTFVFGEGGDIFGYERRPTCG